MEDNKKVHGSLPMDKIGIFTAIILGIQLFVACFPATIFVPMTTKFYVSTALFSAGFATMVALVVTKFRIPMFYGSSFSAIAAVLMVVNSVGGGDTGIRVAQVGIFAAGVGQVLIGLAIKKAGPERVFKVLPFYVTGPTAMIIAWGLSKAAVDMASGSCCGVPGDWRWWTVSIITLVATGAWSIYLENKGFIGMLPILGGAAIGYLAGMALGLTNYAAFASVQTVRAPHLTLPAFTHPAALGAVVTILPVIVATIAESTAHLLQIHDVVGDIAKSLRREVPPIDRLVGTNQMADGAGDVAAGLVGGPMGTNYAEGLVAMLLSKSTSVYIVIVAAVIAMLASFSGHLEAAISSMPTAVTGGLGIYLFGTFGLVGLRMLLSQGVDRLFERKVAFIASLIIVLGLAGGNGYNGTLPAALSESVMRYLPGGVPVIAVADLLGIVLNLILPDKKPVETNP